MSSLHSTRLVKHRDNFALFLSFFFFKPWFGAQKVENILNHSTCMLYTLYITKASSGVHETNPIQKDRDTGMYVTSVSVTIVQTISSFVRPWPHKIIQKFMQQSAESAVMLTLTDQASYQSVQ
jgi:hypothetical protein